MPSAPKMDRRWFDDLRAQVIQKSNQVDAGKPMSAHKTKTGMLSHLCGEFDYLEIDEYSPEIESCSCYPLHMYKQALAKIANERCANKGPRDCFIVIRNFHLEWSYFQHESAANQHARKLATADKSAEFTVFYAKVSYDANRALSQAGHEDE